MSDKPIRLEDIALKAGVTKNTVSIALRNKKGVSESTRIKIRNIAEEMGYKPNPLVSAHMEHLRRQGRQQKTSNLAFLYYQPKKEDLFKQDFMAGLYLGMKSRADQLGYSATPVWAGSERLHSKRLKEILLAQGVVGLVIAPLPSPQRHLKLEWDHFACATLGHSLLRPKLHRASSDLSYCLDTLVRKLKICGYKRIGICIGLNSDKKNNYAWSASFAVQQKRHARILCGAYMHCSPYDPEFAAWLKKEKPDVVVEAGHQGLRDALLRIGLRTPDDIGFVDALGNDSQHETCARMIRRWNDLGAAATDMVSSQLMRNERGIPKIPKTLLIEGVWQDGDTIRTH